MDYIKLLAEINYLSYVTAFAKWIFLFLIISIVILIVCNKLGLFKRRTKTARILVKLYYVIIPIYFIVFAVKYAPIKNTQIEINNAIDKHKVVVTDFAYRFLSSIVSDSVLCQDRSTKEIVNGYLDNYIYKADSIIAEASDYNFIQRLFYKTKRKIEYSFLIGILESEIIDEATSFVGISKKTGKALYRTDLYDLFKEGEIVEIFRDEMNKYFRHFFRLMFFIMFLGLLIPGVEIILAKTFKY